MLDGESRALGSRYVLQQPIGRGAMGEVWRAWDRQAEHTVAAKLLHRHFTNNASIVSRFVQERALLLSLRHPNVIEVLDLVVEGDDLAIVMAFVEGGSLGDYHKSIPTLPPKDVVSAVSGVLTALAFAHQQGVVHRDIKLDNVLLADRETPREASVRLSDFGIARLAQEEAVRATGLLGTPAYMAPEMFELGVFSQASDVYSTGIMFYELLAGRTPFEGGDSPMAVGMRHVYSLPPALPVDDRLWQVIRRMLAKDPAVRLTAQETLASLRELPDEAVAGPALTPQSQPETWLPVDRPVSTGGDLHVTELTGDVGRTFVPDAGGSVAAAAVEGPARALVDAGSGNASGLTMLATETHASRDPSLESQAPLVKTNPHARRRWVIGGLIAGVLVVAVVVFFVLRGGGPTPAATTIDYQPGHLVGTQLASGLRIDYAADKGTQVNTVSLAVGLTAAKDSGLAGGILIALPPEGDQCPGLVSSDWDQPVSAVSQSQDGVVVPCGYKTTLQLTAGQTRNLELVLSGVTAVDLGSWIGQLQQATDDALRGVTGTDFALQRLAGLRVTAEDIQLTGDTPAVPYAVYPVWTNQSDGTSSDPMFSNQTLQYQATDLLMTLTGNEGFDQVTVTACDAALVVGYRIIAEQPTNSCELTVRVGAINPAQTQFAIRMTPS